MAIKANASSMGGGNFDNFVGVGSFRVLGVNPTKKELEAFYGREMQNEPVYLTDKTDNEGKAYKQVRVTFMVQADLQYENGKEIECNKALKEPLKTTISFFVDNRYFYNRDKSKVQVIDKYGRTAWVTIEQAKNHQIPVYKNGPAKLDPNYRPAFRGEEELTQFILNYLNVTPIDTYNSTTGEWITNPHPEDCEGNLEKIQDYFKGNVSELKEFLTYIPTNRIKLLMGIRTDNDGKQRSTFLTSKTLRNGSKSYIVLKKEVDDKQASGGLQNTVFSDDPTGLIQDIHVYNNNVKETDLSQPQNPFEDNPFDSSDELPFEAPDDNDNPFGDMA